tara:strand:+ start:409 stop:774 length:366 start_codon:yes stop_codon:yes gene_type:complete
MDKFLSIIEQNLKVLNEEGELNLPGNVDPVQAAGAPPVDPNVAAPPPEETALPEEEEGEDDPVKLKLDYVEMIRKALIMAPKHIDDVDFAKLTQIVDQDNLERMTELVTRIVRNNYPHPDL